MRTILSASTMVVLVCTRLFALERPLNSMSNDSLLELVAKEHFNYFVDNADPDTGHVLDISKPSERYWQSDPYVPSNISATAFGLIAYAIAERRGWISRGEAIEYTLKVLRSLWQAPQCADRTGCSGYRGFYYRFLNHKTLTRSGKSELSSIDTGLLAASFRFLLFYYRGDDLAETEIRLLAGNLFDRIEWSWLGDDRGRVSLGWSPEEGILPYHWKGANEAKILILLGLGSATYPLSDRAWKFYTEENYLTGYYGVLHFAFPPQFGHQYSHIFLEFRDIFDDLNRKYGFDYFENSRRATIIQYLYAIDNPGRFRAYSSLDWGLTACYGPGTSSNEEVLKEIDRHRRGFFEYRARGVFGALDDGTIAPTAAAASIAFAPHLVLDTLRHWLENRSEIWGRGGFVDAFNPTFDGSKPSGWIAGIRVGIDQGPIVAMIENYRTGLVWLTMKQDPIIRRGLERAGFRGGWLDHEEEGEWP